MPYSGADDPKIPAHVPQGKRAQWAAVWNRAHADCMKRGGENCEGVAFRVANGTIKEAEETKPMKTTILTETIELVENGLNATSREVEVVLIRPGWSSNGRYYAPGVLAKAVGLYENARAFADHPTPEQIKRGEGRSVTQLTGRFYNVRLGEQGELRATRKVYDNPVGNAVWPAIQDTVSSQTAVIGLSINAVGKVSQGKGPDDREGMIVEEITSVASVDDVIAPAAGGGFERLVMGGDDLLHAVTEAMTYDEFIAARPDYMDRLRNELKVVRQTAAVSAVSEARDNAQAALKAAQSEADQLREQIVQLQATVASLRDDKTRKAQEVVFERALAEARLPKTYEKLLREQIAQTDPAQWLDVLRAELEKERIKAQTRVKPVAVSGAGAVRPVVRLQEAGPLNMDAIHTPEDFQRAIRARVQVGG